MVLKCHPHSPAIHVLGVLFPLPVSMLHCGRELRQRRLLVVVLMAGASETSALPGVQQQEASSGHIPVTHTYLWALPPGVERSAVGVIVPHALPKSTYVQIQPMTRHLPG